MKVNNYTAIPPAFPTSVRERQDGGGETGGGAYSPPNSDGKRGQKRKPDSGSTSEGQSADDVGEDPGIPVEPSPELIEHAIKRFVEDSDQSHAQLSVEASGSGPGLRVLLKNNTGEVVRQFSGREFVELNENAATGTHRGRLLDKKI